MNKPSNYDESDAKQKGEFEQVLPGGYICEIVKAEAKTSKKGNEMLVLAMDITEGEFEGHYQKLSETLKKNLYLNFYQLTGEEQTPYFKGLITAIEESNKGFKWNFDELKLIGKKIGVNLREEEYLGANNEVKVGLKIGYCCSVATINEGVTVMKKKTLSGSAPIKQEVRESTKPDESDLPF